MVATASRYSMGQIKMENNISEAKFIDPQEVLAQVNLFSGMKVADFGCGAGFFSLAIAEKIKEEGIVYALDVLTQSLESVASQAKLKGITNIIVKRVNLEKDGGSKLEAGSIDLVVMKDVLFQNQNKNIIINEAKRVLKDEGKILIVEWKKEPTSIGPTVNLRIGREELEKIAGESGLKIEKEIKVGNFHYGIIFTL